MGNKLAAQIAEEQTIKNFNTIREYVGSDNIETQQAYVTGYIARDMEVLDESITKLIEKIAEPTRTDAELDETMNAVNELIATVYKAGFACGHYLG